MLNCCKASQHDISISTMFLSNDVACYICINRVCLAGTAAKGQGLGTCHLELADRPQRGDRQFRSLTNKWMEAPKFIQRSAGDRGYLSTIA